MHFALRLTATVAQAQSILRIYLLLNMLLVTESAINITLDPLLKIQPWPYGVPVLPYAHAVSANSEAVNISLRSDPSFDQYQPGIYHLTFVAQTPQDATVKTLSIVLSQLEIPPASWQGVFQLSTSQTLPSKSALAVAATAALIEPGIAVVLRITSGTDRYLVTYSVRNATTLQWIASKPMIDTIMLQQALNLERPQPAHGILYLIVMAASALLICLLAVAYVYGRRRQLQRNSIAQRAMPADLFTNDSSNDVPLVTTMPSNERSPAAPISQPPLDEAALLSALFKFDDSPAAHPELAV
jgi:hypothetical protein